MGDVEPAGVPAFLEFRLKTPGGDYSWRPEMNTDMMPTLFEVADYNGVPILRVPLPVDEHNTERCRCRIAKVEYSSISVHFDTTAGVVRIVSLAGQLALMDDEWFAFVLNAATVRARARKVNP